MTDHEHLALFDKEQFDHWRSWWQDMPAFEQRDQSPFDEITVLFSSAAERRDFLELLGENPNRRATIWYPSRQRIKKKAETATEPVPAGRYPIYVISKGRADSRLTVRALEALGLDYHLVIEPQEHADYAKHVEPFRILTLPFSNLGQGSIPARNWVWEHALAEGHRRHWILDDNIDGFVRLHENRRTKVVNENPFVSIENFVDRYQNVRIAGMNYRWFCPENRIWPAFRWNTRVYSCILIDNACKHRWRGRYNEDTDLSLRVLKDGDCTALFNHYLANKTATMTMKGGNTDELYAQTDEFDGRLEMAQHLVDQHPDVSRISWKWGRWQHHVDYAPFQHNRPIPITENEPTRREMRTLALAVLKPSPTQPKRAE